MFHQNDSQGMSSIGLTWIKFTELNASGTGTLNWSKYIVPFSENAFIMGIKRSNLGLFQSFWPAALCSPFQIKDREKKDENKPQTASVQLNGRSYF